MDEDKKTAEARSCGFGYKRDANHAAKLQTFERTATGWSPVKEGPTLISAALGYRDRVEKEDKGVQAWPGWRKPKRSPQPKWKVKARKKIKAPPGRGSFAVPLSGTLITRAF